MTYNPAFEDGHCSEQGHVPGCPGAAGGDHEFDLHAAIVEQRTAGGYVIAPLSMLRCSECGDLLDAYGCCVVHGLLDTEMRDGWD